MPSYISFPEEVRVKYLLPKFLPMLSENRDVWNVYGSWYYHTPNEYTFYEEDEFITGDKVIDDWGVTAKTYFDFMVNNASFYDKLEFRFQDKVVEPIARLSLNLLNFLEKKEFHKNYPDVHFMRRLRVFRPYPSVKNPGMVALVENHAKDVARRETAFRPGRAFKKIFPEFSDKDIELLVHFYNEKYPLYKYTLHISQDISDFVKAYVSRNPCNEDLYTTGGRKAIYNSCMRGDKFNHLPHHPVEAYDSGEFMIYFTTTTHEDKEYVGSRCIVWFPPDGSEPQAGPVYGISENSIDIIEDKLKEDGVCLYAHSSGWTGAKFAKIPYGDHSIIGPYVDDDDCKNLEDKGDYLVLTDDCYGYDASCYQGVLTLRGPICMECGCVCDEDDMYTDPNGDPICEGCFDCNYFVCDHSGETAHQDERYLVHRGTKYGTVEVFVREWVVQEYYTYCEHSDEYWFNECVTEIHDGTFVPNRYLKSDYTLCADGEYYPNEEVEVNVEGGPVSIAQLHEDYFFCEECKIWKPKQSTLELPQPEPSVSPVVAIQELAERIKNETNPNFVAILHWETDLLKDE